MQPARNIDFRLVQLLQQRQHALGSYNALENDMEALLDEKIDRRKLKSLCDGEDVALRLSEIKLLDRYLTLAMGHEHSLCVEPILVRSQTLLDSLKGSRSIYLMLGARHYDVLRTDTVSIHDVRASKNILLGVNELGIRVDILDVLQRQDDVEAIKSDVWHHLLQRRERSVIAIGSSFINHATEYLMAEMFGVEPFVSPRVWTGSKRLPCYVVWTQPSERHGVSHSAFLLEQHQVREGYGEIADTLEEGDRAILVGDQLFISRRYGPNYGLIVAQRQDADRVSIVLSGTFGPATHALSKVLGEGGVAAALPAYDPRSLYQSVIIAVVRADVRGLGGKTVWVKDDREWDSARLVIAPALWGQRAGQWKRLERFD